MVADPYDLNDEETIKREFDDYELPEHDKKSIEEIRKKVQADNYKNTDEIENHQEFLEDMTNRLRFILKNEKSIGEVNWELERQIEDIKALYIKLEGLRKKRLK